MWPGKAGLKTSSQNSFIFFTLYALSRCNLNSFRDGFGACCEAVSFNGCQKSLDSILYSSKVVLYKSAIVQVLQNISDRLQTSTIKMLKILSAGLKRLCQHWCRQCTLPNYSPYLPFSQTGQPQTSQNLVLLEALFPRSTWLGSEFLWPISSAPDSLSPFIWHVQFKTMVQPAPTLCLELTCESNLIQLQRYAKSRPKAEDVYQQGNWFGQKCPTWSNPLLSETCLKSSIQLSDCG